ncbi:cancer-associated gene 1 protein [Sorex araneus]|uniref:cancer-associated gene 1 protein n=1 Tax=Sorex araneus TaxID=42254 RepID=UPI0024334634|nr:cancer-associated gene 1 protein [Sorex araneus]
MSVPAPCCGPDIHVGHGSPEAGAWPVSTHSAPAHQYGHLCELHRRRASPEETVTLQPVADDSPYAGGPGHDDSTGRPGEHCSSKDAGPEPGSTRAGGNLLARPSAWQLPRNRPWAHSCGDSPEVTDCSQEVPSPRAGAGRATGQPQEAVDGGRESSRGPGTWSPAGTSCSGGSDSEGSEEGLALNEALRQLRAANREQQAQIRSLRSSNARLESKVRELQAGAAKQRLLAGAIGTLRENVEALIEDKYRAMLEKHELDHALRDLHRVLAGTQTHLRESLSDKETLELELRKVQASYVHLQEKYVAELRPDEPPRPGGQRAEAEPLRQLRGELERAASCTQRLLQGERRARERELLALQEALRQHQREDLEERERVQARLERLGAQVRGLACGKEPARGGGLPEQAGPGTPQLPGSQSQRAPEPPEEPETALDTVQDSEQPTELPLDPSPGQEGSPGSPDSRRASQLAAKVHSVLGLMVGLLSRQGHSPLDADGAAQPPDSEGVGESLVQKLGHLQLKKERLEKELLRHKQRIATFGKSVASSKAAQRRAQSTVTSDQSAPPPVLQGTGRDGSGHGCPQPPATDPGPADTRSVVEVPVLLDTKLDEYHLLNQELGSVVTKLGGLLESKENHCHRLLEENDKYQRHLGSLIDQVASYEEIIQCADQRLAVSCSHITHLEERNRHLEDLIRRPGKQARKLRLRGLEAQPGLAGRAGSRDGHCPEGPAPV